MALKNKVEGAALSAAGVLLVYGGKVLLIYRGAAVVDPYVWCGAGGKVEPGETPEEAALREAQEEIGFGTEMEYKVDLKDLYVYRSDKLVFHNFLGVIDKPFQPTLNWESDGYVWCEWGKWPTEIHYGFKAILEDMRAEPMLRNAMDGSKPKGK